MFILAVLSGKGGSAKTTTAVAIAAASAGRGLRTLLVDADPVGGASYACGVDPDDLPAGRSLHAVLADAVAPDAAEIETSEGFGLLAGTAALVGDEPTAQRRFPALRRSSAAVMVVDTPPGFGSLVAAAAALADRVLVTIPAEPLAVRTLQHVLGLLDGLDATGKLLGVLPTLHDARRLLARDQLRELATAGAVILEPIPRTVVVAEAALAGRSVLGFAPRSPAADAYRRLAALALKGVKA